MTRSNLKSTAREIGRDESTVREWIRNGYLERGEDGMIDLAAAIACRDSRDSWRAATGLQAAQLQHYGEDADARRQASEEKKALQKAQAAILPEYSVPMPQWLANGAWGGFDGDPKLEAHEAMIQIGAGAHGKRWGAAALKLKEAVDPLLEELRNTSPEDSQNLVDSIVEEFEQDILAIRGKNPGKELCFAGPYRGTDGLSTVISRARHISTLEALVEGDGKKEALTLIARRLAANIETEMQDVFMTGDDKPDPSAMSTIYRVADQIRSAAA